MTKKDLVLTSSLFQFHRSLCTEGPPSQHSNWLSYVHGHDILLKAFINCTACTFFSSLTSYYAFIESTIFSSIINETKCLEIR